MVPALVSGSSLGFCPSSQLLGIVCQTSLCSNPGVCSDHLSDLASLGFEKTWSEAFVCPRLLERCGTTRSKMVFTQSKRPAAAAGGSTGKT